MGAFLIKTMNKHFHNILAIMDAAENVPDDIRFTAKKNIMISAKQPLCPSFIRAMEYYCTENYLTHTYTENSFWVKNPKGDILHLNKELDAYLEKKFPLMGEFAQDKKILETRTIARIALIVFAKVFLASVDGMPTK